MAINWALVLVRAVHWWNPVYWVAASRFGSLREQACDAFVIRQLSGQSSCNYGDLLLTLAQRTASPGYWQVRVPASMLAILSSVFRRRAIAARLRALLRAALVARRWHSLTIGTATVLLAYCGWTDAKSNSPPENPAPKPLFSLAFEQSESGDAIHSSSDERADITRIARDYDLHAVLASIAGEQRTLVDARTNLDLSLLWELQQRPSLAAKPRPESKMTPGEKLDVAQSSAADEVEPAPQYKIDGEQLHVTATRQRHAEFARVLCAWEQGGLTQVSVECRFITPMLATNSKIDIPWRDVAPLTSDEETQLVDSSAEQATFRASARVEQFVPVVYAVVDSAKAQALIDEAQMSTSTNILQAPKITTFNGESATIADLSQRPFVVGIREQSPGVLSPKISIVSEGTRLQLRSIVKRDRKLIRLDSRITLCGIGDVEKARVKTSVAAAEPVEVQVPQINRCMIDISSEIPDGHSLLIATQPDRNLQNTLYVVVTPKIVAEGVR